MPDARRRGQRRLRLPLLASRLRVGLPPGARCKSINVSGHKFGLVYPGVGWLVFRDDRQLPEELVFYEDYLGERDATFTLNFSGSSAFILAQYYNFVRFGRAATPRWCARWRERRRPGRRGWRPRTRSSWSAAAAAAAGDRPRPRR